MAMTERTGGVPALGRRFAVPDRVQQVGQTYGAVAALGLLFAINALFSPNFLARQSFVNVVTQVSTVVIVGVGMSLVIGTGGIDLSVGSLMAIAGSLAPLIFLVDKQRLRDDALLWNLLAIAAAVLLAGAFGFFNGVLVAGFRIQPIIATLVLYVAGRGIAQVMTGNGSQISFENPGFQYLAAGRPLGVPFQGVLMVAIVAVAAWVVRATTFGRYLLATGDNERAARLAGVPVARVKVAVYVISGVLAGLAGLIEVAINKAANPGSIGLNMELDAIAAVAVGGTLLTGGRITIVGTMVGALILQLIRVALLSQGVPDAVARIVTAGTIVVAVLIQRRTGA